MWHWLLAAFSGTWGEYEHSYPAALHDTVLGTVAATRYLSVMASPTPWRPLLAIYHAVIVGTLAASLGAYFIERQAAV